MFVGENTSEELDSAGANISEAQSAESVAEMLMYENIRYCSYNIVLPIICLFGLVGNILNIVVFTRSRYRHTLDDIEKSATAGLVALALSDLLFCLVGLPEPILNSPKKGSSEAFHMISLYYKTYKQPLMNLFLFSSTWLIVAISAERYVAVCYPLHARWFIQLKRTIAVDVIIYMLSVLINIPSFLKYQVVRFGCPDGTTSILVTMTSFYLKTSVNEGYRIAYTVMGAFVPLAFLTLCNIRLMVEVYRSRRRYRTERHKYATSKATLILMAIILMYLLLVCPSMLLTFFSDVLSYRSQAFFYRYRTAVVLTNVTQGINFAVNFILYCAVSKPFRDNVKRQLCRSSAANNLSNASETNNPRGYQLVGTHAETGFTRALPLRENTHL